MFMNRHYLDRLFRPRTVAVYGASDRPGSLGQQVFANLAAGNFSGTLLPINPKHREVAGRPALASAREAGQPIDLAIVATGSAALPDIVADGAAAGIRHAIILSLLYRHAEDAGGPEVSAALAAAQAHGVRFLGPRCLGIQRPELGLNASLAPNMAAPGRLALVSQSRGLTTAIVDWASANGAGFSSVISAGPQDGVRLGEILDFLVSDPATDGVLLFVEAVRDARRFMSALRAAARFKPVVVLKAGRARRPVATPAGGLGIASDAVVDAVLARVGAVRVTSVPQLFAAALTLTTRRRPRGEHLAVVTNSHGAGLLAGDALVARGYPLADWDPASTATLAAALPAPATIGNPLDVRPDADAERLTGAVAQALADPGMHAVLALVTPQYPMDADAAARALVEQARQTAKPLLSCWMGGTRMDAARAVMSNAGAPSYKTPEGAVDGFAFMATHWRNRRLMLQVPEPIGETSDPDVDAATALLDQALAGNRRVLNAVEAKRLLAAFAIESSESVLTDTAGAAVAAARRLGYPVAVKISSPDLPSKTDVGGVRLNVPNASELAEAYRGVRAAVAEHAPEAAVDGVIVEQMWSRPHGRELLVEVVPDPDIGPVIAFGLGGLAADAFSDRALALPPLNDFLARQLVGSTQVSRMLGAFHDQPPAAIDALVAVLLRVSEMACELPGMASLVINPLILDTGAARAIDARVTLRAGPYPPRYGHMAIHPYPSRLRGRWRSRDGVELALRPLRPEDAHALQDFVRRLSDESRLMRFMSAVRELTPEMMARLTQLDYDREMALVAVAPASGQGSRENVGDTGREVAGVAHYAANPDERSCEFAVVVADDWQGRGLGGELMRRIVELARGRGFTHMEGITRSDNRAMQTLSRQLGFSVSSDPEDAALYRLEKRL